MHQLAMIKNMREGKSAAFLIFPSLLYICFQAIRIMVPKQSQGTSLVLIMRVFHSHRQILPYSCFSVSAFFKCFKFQKYLHLKNESIFASFDLLSLLRKNSNSFSSNDFSPPIRYVAETTSGFLLEFRRFKIFSSTLKNLGILEGNNHQQNVIRMKTASRRKIFQSVGITGLRGLQTSYIKNRRSCRVSTILLSLV